MTSSTTRPPGLESRLHLLWIASLAGTLLVSCLMLSPADLGAQEQEMFKGVPWYDSDQSEVKSLPLDSLESSAADHRDSDWVHVPKSQQSSSQSFWDWLWGGNRSGGNSATGGNVSPLLSRIVSWIVWILIGIICLALLIWVAWLLVKQEWRNGDSDQDMDWLQNPQIDPARFEALPFEVNAPETDLLGLARKAQAEGRTREAIIYLYSYMLLMLDQKHLIHLARGKTNRTYLREIRSQRALHTLLEKIVVTFEDVFFGDLALDPSEFQARWSDLHQFHQLIGLQKA
jgi:hypothetical protein